MRQLLPDPIAEFDVPSLTDRADRTPPTDRPWVMANMIMSTDGAYALEGRSAGLGGAADRLVFHTLRAAADVVLVAAGTARQERYRRPTTLEHLVPLRRTLGLADAPRLVVVSRTLHLPADQPFLDGAGDPPLVLHPDGADTSTVPEGVELRAAGTGGGVDLAAALRGLRAEGVEQVLCEGGPDLLGQLRRLGLLDELFLTISPTMVGGGDVGLLGTAAEPHLTGLVLHRVLEDSGFLLLTYRDASTGVDDQS